MKKILATLIGLALAATLVHAQGYLNWATGPGGVTTNTSLLGSPGTADIAAGYNSVVSGNMSASSSGSYYYFTILAWNGIGSDSSAANLTDGDFTQVYQDIAGVEGGAEFATNYPSAAGIVDGAGSGGNAAQLWGIPGGIATNLVLVGWSSNLGASWSAVESELAANTWNANGFFGYEVGNHALNSSSPGISDVNFWPSSTMVLYSVPVPEPTTLALAGLGGMALLAFRRRNKKS